MLQQINLFDEMPIEKRTAIKVKDYSIEVCSIKNISHFIEKWHYSKNVNGLSAKYCFKLMDGEKLIGAMIYGSIAMANVWKKYVKQEEDLLELRRLCCIDDTFKNTESYFIGGTIKWLKKNTKIKTIISYADETYGHSGIIYKATNFEYKGMTKPGRVIWYKGKRYHDKTIRTRYKGSLKPYAKEIKIALEKGEAEYESTLGKHVYIYKLRSEKQ